MKDGRGETGPAGRMWITSLAAPLVVTIATMPGCGSDALPRATPSPTQPRAPDRLHTEGRWIRDARGRAVILRGINVGSRSKLPPFLPFEDVAYLDQLVDWGVNSLRLVFTWEGVEPERGRYDGSYVASLRRILDGCRERGMLAILDAHQDLFARNFCGDGFPGWAVHPDYQDVTCPEPFPLWPLGYLFDRGVIDSFHRFWESAELQDAYIEMMVHLAEELGPHPALAGVDLLNEPFDFSYLRFDGDFERTVLAPFYVRLIQAVRPHLPEHLISYGTTGLFSVGLPTYLEPLGLSDDLVFGAHWYDLVALLLHVPVDAGSLRDRLADLVSLTEDWRTPLWIGEFGVPTDTSDNLDFLQAQMRILDEFLVGSAVWAYNPTDLEWNDENTSLVFPGGAEKPHVSVFVRPYPARVAGTPLAFRYDPETGDLELTFRADPGVSGPTEIVLPARCYPAGFEVEAAEGEWDWDAARRRLLYRTPQDGGTRTLRLGGPS